MIHKDNLLHPARMLCFYLCVFVYVDRIMMDFVREVGCGVTKSKTVNRVP